MGSRPVTRTKSKYNEEAHLTYNTMVRWAFFNKNSYIIGIKKNSIKIKNKLGVNVMDNQLDIRDINNWKRTSKKQYEVYV